MSTTSKKAKTKTTFVEQSCPLPPKTWLGDGYRKLPICLQSVESQPKLAPLLLQILATYSWISSLGIYSISKLIIGKQDPYISTPISEKEGKFWILICPSRRMLRPGILTGNMALGSLDLQGSCGGSSTKKEVSFTVWMVVMKKLTWR